MKATALGWLLLLLAATPQSLDAQVTLEEVDAIPLPSGFRPVGIAVGHENVLLWGPGEGSLVLVDEGRQATEHRLGLGRISAGAWDGQRWQVVLDSGEALALSADFEVLAEGEIELPPQASAVWREGEWRVLSVGPDGVLLDGVAVRGSAGVGRLLGARDHLMVRRAGEHWVVAKLFPPYWAARVDPDGGRVLTSFEPLPFEYSVMDGRPPRWAAMPVVPLGPDGFLQVVSDLQSTSRVLFRYSADGKIMGRTDLESPLAFVASEEERRRLWAVRTLEHVELVEYAWRQ